MRCLCLLSFFVILSLSISKTVTFISDSKQARDERGIVVAKFTFHGNQAKAQLRGNDSIGGLYFFPREKLLDRFHGDCNQFLRKASFSLFPTKSSTEFKERLFPLWSHEPHTFYALFVDAATCYPQYPTQSRVGLELHLVNDVATGGHLSAEESGLKAALLLLLLFYTLGAGWFGLTLYSSITSGGHIVFAMKLFLACTALQGASIMFPTIHWLSYESSGWGTPFLNSLTTPSSLGADLTMIALVLDIVLGWTLGSCKRISTSRSELVCRGVAGLSIIHTILHFYTQTLDPNNPSYYTLSAPSEVLLGFVWVVEGVMFLAVLAGTYKDDRSALRQDFYASFAWIILLWFLSYPITQLIVLVMAEHNRLKVFLALSQFLRCCALGQMANLFIRRSLFWEVSSLSATSLPFAERTFASKGEPAPMFGGYMENSKLTKRH